ncbi:heterokaryon incompatibility protein-domain-containing protein [Truncatella angustata]|uniref:Heterokaryon incompatibility protein-domain-containing protein n=1 Tax=Truncatella angustata TaxID=152316 RepID=A0A9P8UBU6_9PEZI|nr:heterokaryon incompatibility protein-domain-containing protein [Truncatella angustata]KAH6644962.1 heterokaryon incompatibility protein-domain-containing protein [Truncatella angustata]
MRLLNVHNLLLEEFPAEPPRYAVLSHTWDDGEIQFRDLSENEQASVRNKKGYQKIQGVCRMAKERALDWCWVDTCCIDKTSSAELSEAINSMFKWYQNAEICFVYLSDLSVTEAGGQGRQAKSLSSSRWFSRGWTLQELIAPKTVLFYDYSWEVIGEKCSIPFRTALSTVTGIPELVLTNDEKLQDIAVAQRMSWAAGRKTTKPEDMAYCLLGIFDVGIPILYGEGPRAFFRLQEEILKNTTDTSIFAWTADGHAEPRGLLAESVNEFLG